MSAVYVVVENGEAYPFAYSSYAAAVAAVKDKHKVYLEEMIKELQYLEDIERILSDINVPQDLKTGKTLLYIEKGINILIHCLPIL